VTAPVTLVDVLDHLFTPPGLDVDVDIGRPVTRRERKRSKKEVERTASALVMPSEKQTAELAAEPRPCSRCRCAGRTR